MQQQPSFNNQIKQVMILVLLLLLIFIALKELYVFLPGLLGVEEVAQQALNSKNIDLIILGIEELETGCAFAARLRSQPTHADIPIIFIVPQLSSHWAANLQEQGGVFCILRSMDPDELLDLVQKALWMPHLAERRRTPGKPTTHPNAPTDWVKLD